MSTEETSVQELEASCSHDASVRPKTITIIDKKRQEELKQIEEYLYGGQDVHSDDEEFLNEESQSLQELTIKDDESESKLEVAEGETSNDQDRDPYEVYYEFITEQIKRQDEEQRMKQSKGNGTKSEWRRVAFMASLTGGTLERFYQIVHDQ